MALESSRQSLVLLACAVAISVVLSFPMEQTRPEGEPPGSTSSACSDKVHELNLGTIVRAILTPIFVFLLPGPGSVLRRKRASSSSRRPSLAAAHAVTIPAPSKGTSGPTRLSVAGGVVLLVVCSFMLLAASLSLRFWIGNRSSVPASGFGFATAVAISVIEFAISLSGIGAGIYLLGLRVSRGPVSFIAAGCACAAVTGVAWWHGLREYAGLQVCPDLFDLNRSTDPMDYLSACAHYFIYLSGFSALWVGIVAGGLRSQSARAEENSSADRDLCLFRDFYWACLLGWAVQYRLSQWFVHINYPNQDWAGWAFMDFVFVSVSSLWVLAFIHPWWKKKPQTWLHAVWQALWRSFVILLLTTLTFSWLIMGATGTLKPFATWNVFGLAWALVLGTWRWRALQQERLVVAPPA
ncbi:MAG: hypothetical protein WAN76_16095 [Candidatus Sulfotelmatobacter sp.]